MSFIEASNQAKKLKLRSNLVIAQITKRTRIWRNWQTRKTKDLVEQSLQVQVLLSAPNKNKTNPRDNSQEFVLFFNKDWFGIKFDI